VQSHSDITRRQDAVDAVLGLRGAALDTRPEERVALDEPFEDRTLASALVAEADVPRRSHATMDGYAVDATAPEPHTVVASEVYPEDDPPAMESGDAVRVATGAPVPEAANAVLKVEDVRVEAGELTGPDVAPGTYVYERGSNVEAGETLFEAGETLSAKDAVLLCDLGFESVSVFERFDAGLLATGTEIHEGRSEDLDSPMLASLVRSWGGTATVEGTVPDEYERVRDGIAGVAERRDVVITTGGTSVGRKDHVVRALRELGDVSFHRVAIRPGKPVAAARLPEHDAVAFAIPGKPVGAHTVATLVMRPFFTGETSHPTVAATATAGVELPGQDFEYAVPVTLDDGAAEPLGHVSSALPVYDDVFDPSVLSSSTRATRADGIVLTRSGFAAGETLRVIPYGALE